MKSEIINGGAKMNQTIVVYGDIFVFLLLLWNGYFIFITAQITGYHLSKFQWFVSILAMTVCSFAALKWSNWRMMFLMILGIIFLFLFRHLKFLVIGLLVTIFAGGLWIIFPRYGEILAVIGLFLTMLYLKYRQKSNFYTVYCQNHGKKIQLTALYDTGNQLYIPESRKPVSLVSYKSIEPILDWNELEKPQIVPFSSVGEEQGLLFAIQIEAFIISEQNLTMKRPYIGVVHQPLSNDGKYQMILHRDIFC